MKPRTSEAASADASQSANRAPFLAELQNLIEQFAKARLGGDDRGAFAQSLEALALAAEEAEQNPTPDIELLQEAADREARADWEGAERTRREILTLREAEANEGCLAKAHLDLSMLFQLRGRLDMAWDSALKACAAAREFGVGILTAMTLQNQAGCALLRGDADGAMRAIDEAFAGLEPTRLTRGMRARLWVSRARCLSAKRDWHDAEAALSQARRLLDEESPPACCPGPIATEAGYWEVRAVILAAHGDRAGAVKAWADGVANRRMIVEVMHPQSPHAAMALSKALEGYGDALIAIGRTPEAESAHEEARALRRRVETGVGLGDTRQWGQTLTFDI